MSCAWCIYIAVAMLTARVGPHPGPHDSGLYMPLTLEDHVFVKAYTAYISSSCMLGVLCVHPELYQR
jgi:hypothetical protein